MNIMGGAGIGINSSVSMMSNTTKKKAKKGRDS
jgi:hypothetical protein